MHNLQANESKGAKCVICNRALTNPVSIELGMGPVCRGNRGVPSSKKHYNSQQLNLFMRSKYHYQIVDGILVIYDDAANEPRRSLTNDMENVLVEIATEKELDLLKTKIIYKDSEGIFDRVIVTHMDKRQVHNDYQFLQTHPHYYARGVTISFQSIGTPDMNEAIGFIKALPTP